MPLNAHEYLNELDNAPKYYTHLCGIHTNTQNANSFSYEFYTLNEISLIFHDILNYEFCSVARYTILLNTLMQLTNIQQYGNSEERSKMIKFL